VLHACVAACNRSNDCHSVVACLTATVCCSCHAVSKDTCACQLLPCRCCLLGSDVLDIEQHAYLNMLALKVKAIADPSMHSMPAAAHHPSGKYISFQGLDSQITTYGTTGKFRVNKKKVFKGHLVGGTACQVRFLCLDRPHL
jgi:hypothetical protein